jgi:retron-type reverse transcriptase
VAINSTNSKPKISNTLKVLDNIYRVNRLKLILNQPQILHRKVFDLTTSADLLRIAYNKLKKNKGALTPGSNNSTADGMSQEILDKIQRSLIQNSFKWSAVLRIMIPKPGKKELRPLGLPDFDNKVVQECIRMVLDSIYEPEFEAYNTNYGFRPGKGVFQAIDSIRLWASGSDYVIEGDIKGAYPSVNFEILLNLLKERIGDIKFLKLIKSGLNAGIMEGNVISPLLVYNFDR